MKDMYTFDVSLEEAKKTYDAVNEQYVRILNHLRIPFIKITADTGTMGGKISHEYHLITDIGEDSIISCAKCSKAINTELSRDDKICENCNPADLKSQQGIEIGHTFILEDRYSKVFKATFLNKTGKPEVLQMGCYGIGVTRLIAASIELLSSENELRWSQEIAPYKVCILPPKEGSKEESSTKHLENEIYSHLKQSLCDDNDIAIDDRTHMTIGKRLMEMKKLGIPYLIVVGAKSADMNYPTVEVHDLAKNSLSDLSINDAVNYISKSIKC